MKDSWFLYDYVRRWWWLMLTAVMLSGALGLAHVTMNARPPAYIATATVTIVGPKWVTVADSPAVGPIELSSGPLATQRAAMDALDKKLARIITYTTTPAKVGAYSVIRQGTGEPGWLQNVVMGSVVALLMMIGAVYVWEDAKAYRRHLLTAPNPS